MADDPNEITAEQFMQGEEVAAPEPQKKSRSVLFSPVQQRQYELLVRNPKTTTEQFSKWFVDNGFGSPENAGEVLKFFKKNPKAPIANYFNQNELSPTENIPTNDKGQPQPGTPTDLLPDAIQGSIERLGLSLGIIDPKTYYGVGNYGENAVKPANPDVLTNPAIPSLGQRFVRSIGETFDETGSGAKNILTYVGEDGYKYVERSDGKVYRSGKRVRASGGAGKPTEGMRRVINGKTYVWKNGRAVAE